MAERTAPAGLVVGPGEGVGLGPALAVGNGLGVGAGLAVGGAVVEAELGATLAVAKAVGGLDGKGVTLETGEGTAVSVGPALGTGVPGGAVGIDVPAEAVGVGVARAGGAVIGGVVA